MKTIKTTVKIETKEADEDFKIFIYENANMEIKDEIYIVNYEEKFENGMEGTNTKLMIDKNYLIVERSGNNKSKMKFETGVKDEFIHVTPHLNVPIENITTEYKMSKTDNTVNVKMKYIRSIAKEETIVNFKISIKWN